MWLSWANTNITLIFHGDYRFLREYGPWGRGNTGFDIDVERIVQLDAVCFWFTLKTTLKPISSAREEFAWSRAPSLAVIGGIHGKLCNRQVALQQTYLDNMLVNELIEPWFHKLYKAPAELWKKIMLVKNYVHEIEWKKYTGACSVGSDAALTFWVTLMQICLLWVWKVTEFKAYSTFCLAWYSPRHKSWICQLINVELLLLYKRVNFSPNIIPVAKLHK